MQVPLEIACPDFELTDGIRTLIYDLAAKLDKVCDHITSCRVTIEMPQKHQASGNSFRVRIEAHIPPRHDLVVKRDAGQGDIHDQLPFIIHEGFEALERQVQKINEIQHGQVKTHPDQEVSGFISKIFPVEGYGFIEALDGRDIYFHKNSVLNGDFDRLTVGTGVHYVEESGEDGPQASTVKIVDKPGVRAQKIQQ